MNSVYDDEFKIMKYALFYLEKNIFRHPKFFIEIYSIYGI